MEQRNDTTRLLDLMARPAFCVAEGRICRVNEQAAAFGISTGLEIGGLLLTGEEEYAAFEGGCLYLTLSILDQRMGASVSRLEDCDIFCLEDLADSRELRAMALAARELRTPLNTVMITAQRLFPVSGLQDDPATREQVAQLNRGLFQILRVIGNMSDAGRSAPSPAAMETVDLAAVLREVFAKAEALVSHTQASLTYEDWPEPVFCLADRQSLERAVLNMISNAVKFSRPGDAIRGSLTRRGQKLFLTLTDSGSGIPAGIRGDVFTRYQRQCGIEDSRFGIGLGLVLIRAAAAAHGGTVLIDQPGGTGTRVTMTLAIRQGDSRLRADQLRVDYAGEQDHALIELSESLPLSLYEKEY